MHADRSGDVLQDHRFHVLLTLGEELALTLDDRAGDLQEGVVADLEALEEPTRLLQLRTQQGMAAAPCTLADQAGVLVVDAQTGQGATVELHRPAACGALHHGIGDDVFRSQSADEATGFRVAGADEGHRGDQRLIVGRIILALQAFRFERPA